MAETRRSKLGRWDGLQWASIAQSFTVISFFHFFLLFICPIATLLAPLLLHKHRQSAKQICRGYSHRQTLVQLNCTRTRMKILVGPSYPQETENNHKSRPKLVSEREFSEMVESQAGFIWPLWFSKNLRNICLVWWFCTKPSKMTNSLK